MKLSPLHNKYKLGFISSPTPKPHVFPSSHSFSKVNSTPTSDATVSKRAPPQPPRHPYSPKNWESLLERANGPARLARHWPDYQGARDWDGLLSPLDPDLRSEILRYGNFVEAAYRSFDFDPSSPSYATCRFRKKDLLDRAGFPGTGYRLTKNLRATSGIQMPRWTERAASWAAVQSSWIGYVAVCTDKAEIKRLGRRDVVIALRGTATCLEWLENVRATLTGLPGGAMVESGFLSLYTSGTATCPSLQETVRGEVARILETYEGEEVSFTITGHSLGAALATIAAYDLKTAAFKESAAAVTVMSFGGPRVGNRSFRRHVEGQGTKILRIVNAGDVITKLPIGLVDMDSGMNEYRGWGRRAGEWLQKRVEETQWAYAEVGRELRLVDVAPPYMVGMNPVKCHELKTYLSLVGSTTNCCPLREPLTDCFDHKQHAKSPVLCHHAVPTF